MLWPRREAVPRRTARVPWIPIVIISVIVIMAIFAPLLAPHSPIDQTLRDKLLPPAWMLGGKDKYLLGTDAFGRDILSRLIYGARVSLLVALLALTAGGGIGRLTYEAVIYRDFPLLQAVIILKSILILGINLGVDILYAYVDPRIRLA